MIARVRGRLAESGGYTLSELIVVVAILLIVVGALGDLFVSASHAQQDMSNRFQAQQNARLALTKLRQEIHCTSNATNAADGTALAAGTSYSAIRFTLPGYCPSNPTAATTQATAYATWCTAPVAGWTNRYQLWRYVTTNATVFVGVTGAPCGGDVTGATKTQWADFLTSPSVFPAPGYAAPAGGNLGTLSIDLPVDLTPSDTRQRYDLQDSIVLRNTTRS